MEKRIDLKIDIIGNVLQRKIDQLVFNYTYGKVKIESVLSTYNDTNYHYHLYLNSNITNKAFINDIKSFINGIIALYKSY